MDPAMGEWLRECVYNDVNLGLCILSRDPAQAYVATAAAAVSSARNDAMRGALSQCISEAYPGRTQSVNRSAAKACLHWLDACVFHIASESTNIASGVV